MPATLAPVTPDGTARQSAAVATRGAPTLQDAWLGEQLRRRVTVRLSDSKTLAGLLVGYDAYSLTLQVEHGKPPMLIYKQHIAYLRAEERA